MKEKLLAVLLAVSFSAQAQDAFNGEALLKGCKALLDKPANPQSSAYENYLSGMCTGLIIGNVGHNNIQEDLGNPRLFCLKKGGTINDYASEIVSFLKKNQEALILDAPNIVTAVMAANYPCPESGKK